MQGLVFINGGFKIFAGTEQGIAWKRWGRDWKNGAILLLFNGSRLLPGFWGMRRSEEIHLKNPWEAAEQRRSFPAALYKVAPDLGAGTFVYQREES